MKFSALLLLCLGVAAVIEHASAGCISMPSLLNVDTTTMLSVRKKADGIKVQKLCLGVDYIVRIKFTEPRKFLLSATSGILEALTGPCANQTQKTTAQTQVDLPLTLGCDIADTSKFKFKLASKVPGAAVYLSKHIAFGFNPLSSCPKSRCNLQTGNTTAAVTEGLSGVPLFDLFSKMGVVMGLGTNQLLNFDVSKINKTIGAEAFLQVLMSIGQLKMMSAKTLIDPVMMLSLLSKLSGVVTMDGTNSTSIAFTKECSKLLTLWPNFWGVSSASGLYTSTQWAEAIQNFMPIQGGVADNFVALQKVYSQYATAKNPANSLLSIMSSIGSVVSEGDSEPFDSEAVSVETMMGLLGSYTSLLALASK